MSAWVVYLMFLFVIQVYIFVENIAFAKGHFRYMSVSVKKTVQFKIFSF